MTSNDRGISFVSIDGMMQGRVVTERVVHNKDV